MAELQEIFESFQCKICMNEYNNINLPRIVCKNDHIICKICFDQIPNTLCPYCKQRMRHNYDYRHLLKIKEATKTVLQRQRKYSSEILHLVRRVDILRLENTDLAKFKDVIQEAIVQSDIGFKLQQIPNTDGPFDVKIEQLATHIKEAIKILNQKSKKIDILLSQYIISEMNIRQITVQLQIQKNYSKGLFKQLQDLKGHIVCLDKQIESLKDEIHIIQKEKTNLVLELQHHDDYYKDSIQDMRRNQREFYDYQIKMSRQGLEQRIGQILSQKLSVQQELSRLKTQAQDKQTQLKKQIKTIQEEKVKQIRQKQQMRHQLKNIEDKMLESLKRNQQFKQKLMANQTKTTKLQIDNIRLLKQKEQLDDTYLTQLQLFRTKIDQLNKDCCERSKQINQTEDYVQNSQLSKAQLQKLKQKRLMLNEQTSRNIKKKLQRLLALCNNQSTSQFGYDQHEKSQKPSINSCKCLKCQVQEVTAFVVFSKQRIAGLMKEILILSEKNSLFNEISKRFTFNASFPQPNFHFLKKYYRQQQQRYTETIQKYKAGQKQFQRKIKELENSIQQHINENNQIRQQLRADHHASSKIHHELINKELLLRDQIFNLKVQNNKITNKLIQSSPVIPELLSQLEKSLKNQRKSLHQPRSQLLPTKYIQQERKLSKSVHNPSKTIQYIDKYERHSDLYPCKLINGKGLDFSDQNKNRQNISHRVSQKKWLLSQSRPACMSHMQNKTSSSIDNNLLRASTARKLINHHRSITSFIQSKMQLMKKRRYNCLY